MISKCKHERPSVIMLKLNFMNFLFSYRLTIKIQDLDKLNIFTATIVYDFFIQNYYLYNESLLFLLYDTFVKV